MRQLRNNTVELCDFNSEYFFTVCANAPQLNANNMRLLFIFKIVGLRIFRLFYKATIIKCATLLLDFCF